MARRYPAVNYLVDLIRSSTTLNLNARDISPFYQEGRVDFDTECCWKIQKVNQLKDEVRTQLNLSITVSSKLRSRGGFPSRLVKLKIRHYPNVQPRRPTRQSTPRITLGPEDEDELGW